MGSAWRRRGGLGAQAQPTEDLFAIGLRQRGLLLGRVRALLMALEVVNNQFQLIASSSPEVKGVEYLELEKEETS